MANKTPPCTTSGFPQRSAPSHLRSRSCLYLTWRVVAHLLGQVSQLGPAALGRPRAGEHLPQHGVVGFAGARTAGAQGRYVPLQQAADAGRRGVRPADPENRGQAGTVRHETGMTFRVPLIIVKWIASYCAGVWRHRKLSFKRSSFRDIYFTSASVA